MKLRSGQSVLCMWLHSPMRYWQSLLQRVRMYLECCLIWCVFSANPLVQSLSPICAVSSGGWRVWKLMCRALRSLLETSLKRTCGMLWGETAQRARKELLWYSVHRPFRQHHHAGQRIHLYFNSDKASLLFQGRRCWSPPAAWFLGGVWGRAFKMCWVCVPGEHEEFRTRCHTRRCSEQKLCT